MCTRASTRVFICMYLCAYACVLLILRPWVRRGPFIHARSPKCCLKAISMNHSTTIAHCQFGPLGYAGFLGFHFCISPINPPSCSPQPPCPSSAAVENNHNKKQSQQWRCHITSIARMFKPAQLGRFAYFPRSSCSPFFCIRTRLCLWLAGCELSAR